MKVNINYIIRQIEKSDIENVVRIHCASFPTFFLSQLGVSFLKVYYNAFRKSKLGVMLGYFEGGKLLGFCAATEQSTNFNIQLIISDFMMFSLQGVKLLFTNINALLRLYRNSKKTNSEFFDEGQYAELFSIAVAPNSQNLGVGKQLLYELENELKRRKCQDVTLTTDAENNENTLMFYNKMGYDLMYEFKAYPNRKMFRLIKKL